MAGMNWFMVVIAVLYLGAAGWEYVHGRGLMAVVYLSWFVLNLALAVRV